MDGWLRHFKSLKSSNKNIFFFVQVHNKTLHHFHIFPDFVYSLYSTNTPYANLYCLARLLRVPILCGIWIFFLCMCVFSGFSFQKQISWTFHVALCICDCLSHVDLVMNWQSLHACPPFRDGSRRLQQLIEKPLERRKKGWGKDAGVLCIFKRLFGPLVLLSSYSPQSQVGSDAKAE